MQISEKELHFLYLTWEQPLRNLIETLDTQQKEALFKMLPFLDTSKTDEVFEIDADFATADPLKFTGDLEDFPANLKIYCDAYAYTLEKIKAAEASTATPTVDSNLLLNAGTAAAMASGTITFIFGLVMMNHVIAFTGLAVATKSAIGYAVTKGALNYAATNSVFASSAEKPVVSAVGNTTTATISVAP